MAPSHTVAGSMSRGMAYSLIVVSLLLNQADAAEPEQVSIQKLLSPQATSYQQHLVTLEGVTSELQVLPPAVGAGKTCRVLYGRASFRLEDETGSLTVEVLGSCKQSAARALPRDGDRVRVTGVVHVRETEPPRDVRILTTQIQILQSN
jgi:hypothetical protein